MYLLLELYAIVQSLSQSTTDKHLDTSKRNGSRFCGISFPLKHHELVTTQKLCWFLIRNIGFSCCNICLAKSYVNGFHFYTQRTNLSDNQLFLQPMIFSSIIFGKQARLLPVVNLEQDCFYFLFLVTL